MPEGPEVWILARALQTRFSTSVSRGKHVWVDGVDYTFGLFGGLRLGGAGELVHVKRSTVSGEAVPLASLNEYELGPDWCTASERVLAELGSALQGRKKMLGALLTDQSIVCGLGVAWASEVCAEARLQPHVHASDQDMASLGAALLVVRERVLKVYETHWAAVQAGTGDPLVAFLQGWFESLYRLRDMRVYKTGTPVKVAGRIFWVSHATGFK